MIENRGLSEEILRINRVGFDPGSRHLDRLDGIPRSPGIVLPVLDGSGRAVFTQTRRLGARLTGPRYLNCASRVAPNPRLAVYRTLEEPAGPVVVCEGAIDALTAADAGLRSAAVLGSAIADATVAGRLASLGADVVVAFDADDAGDRGAANLACLLRARGTDVSRLRPPAETGDLNAWALAKGGNSHDAIRRAVARSQADSRAPPALSR